MRADAILAAAAIDALAGEPRRAHPVRLMGAYLRTVREAAARRARAERSTPADREAAADDRDATAADRDASAADRGAAAYDRQPATGAPRALTGRCGARDRRLGTLAVASGCAAWALVGWWAGRAARGLPAPVSTLAAGVLLKPTLAIRALLEAGEAVRHALAAGELERARALLAMHLVSRPTDDLAADEVAGAAIESLAENLTDSIVAPLLAVAAGGAGAAYAYRFLNTADAVLGYRTPELVHLGRFAARADDAANVLPARLAALLIAAAASAAGASARDAATATLRDHALTESPNAGWTMAAMAGALGVRLTKRGAYVLNAPGRPAGPDDLRRAIRIVALASSLAVLGAAGLARAREVAR